MIEFMLAYLTRLSGKQLVYSTSPSTQSTGLFTGMNITMYKPGVKVEGVGTIWMDEDIYKETTHRAEHPTCYIQVDKSGPEWRETGVTMSVADYQASLTGTPAPTVTPTEVDTPVQESAPI